MKLRRRQVAIAFVGRECRWQENDLVEMALLPAALGEQKMPVMYWIKRSAE